MGAIQGSINSMIGTAALGIAGAKKIIADKQSAEAAKAANLDKAVELEGSLPEQDAAIDSLDKQMNKLKEDNPDIGTPAEAGILSAEEASGDAELPDSLTKAQEALTNMTKQRDAKIALRDLTKKRIEALRGGSK